MPTCWNHNINSDSDYHWQINFTIASVIGTAIIATKINSSILNYKSNHLLHVLLPFPYFIAASSFTANYCI